jgi:hypothetical protein
MTLITQPQAVPPQLEGLPDMKPEDMAFFGKLLQVRGAQGGRVGCRAAAGNEFSQHRVRVTAV